ncbi:MAG: hypothetical protein ABIA04_11765 [Pseudomonadota bacterium]
MKKILFIILGMLFLSTVIFAFPQSPNTYRGLRPLGMGNAFIAVADDQNALSYNVAGLNDVEKWRVEILNPTFEVSLTVYDIIKEVLEIVDEMDSSSSSTDQSEIIEDVVDANLGRLTTLRAAISPSFTMKNFGIRFLGDARGRFHIRNSVFPNVYYTGKADVGMMLGGAYGLWDKALQFGLGLKPMYRLSTGEVVLGAHNLSTLEDEVTDFHTGFGVGVDVGLKSHLDAVATKADLSPKVLRVMNFLRPMVGLTYQDIANTRFQDADSNKQTIGLGTAVHMDWKVIKNTFAIDFRDLTWSSPFISKLCIGWETWFDKYFALRFGVHQGRPSGGLTLDLWLFKLEGAIYAEEIGEYNRVKGDYRGALQLVLGF